MSVASRLSEHEASTAAAAGQHHRDRAASVLFVGSVLLFCVMGAPACTSSREPRQQSGAAGESSRTTTDVNSAGADTTEGAAGFPPEAGGSLAGSDSSMGGMESGQGGATGGDAPGGGNTDPGNAAPSCEGAVAGLADCGAHQEECCVSPVVPGGSFYRQYAFDSGGTPIQLAAPATVSAFRLDKYSVTVGRFRRYVDYLMSDAGGPPVAGSGKHSHLNDGNGLINSANAGTAPYELGWDASWNQYISAGKDAEAEWSTSIGTWTPSPSGHENLPMLGTSWYQAYSFCIWDGGFLPTAAEWLFAATGGEEQRKYPWGAEEPGTANQYAIYDCLFPVQSKTCTDPLTAIAPVGTAVLGGGRWGHFDQQGEVPQLVLDLYAASYPSPCTDCAYAAGGLTFRVAMGTSFQSDEVENRTQPSSAIPARKGYGGFRCARAP